MLSKAIGGGYPMSVIVYAEHLDTWGPGMHAGTFRGNQVAMVAGATTMRYIKEHDLVGNAARRGEQLQSGLEDIARHFPFIGDVRGRGLMLGVEIVKPGSGSRPGLGDGARGAGDQAGVLRQRHDDRDRRTPQRGPALPATAEHYRVGSGPGPRSLRTSLKSSSAARVTSVSAVG